MLQDLSYEADAHYVAGILEIYGHDGRVLELDGCKVLSQHLGDGPELRSTTSTLGPRRWRMPPSANMTAAAKAT